MNTVIIDMNDRVNTFELKEIIEADDLFIIRIGKIIEMKFRVKSELVGIKDFNLKYR